MTRHTALENVLNNMRTLILFEFIALFTKHGVTEIPVEPDFVISFVPNDYTPKRVFYDASTDELTVELENNDGGDIMPENVRVLNTDDMLALLYWATDAVEPQP